MNKKKIGILIAIISIIAFILNSVISYAKDETLYINLTKTGTTGVGYGIGNPAEAGGAGKYIWNLTTYNSNNINDISAKQRNLYCVKAEYGDTWNSTLNGYQNIIPYNLSYDLQGDRQKLLSQIVDKGTDVDDIVKTLLNPETGHYREILWIFDNAYISGTTNKDKFLEKLGIVYEPEINGYTHYYGENNQLYHDLSVLITDEDIMAVQRAAIWHYTNYGNSTYNQLTKDSWLTITTNGTNYTYLDSYNNTSERKEGEDRFYQAKLLYDYLVNNAASHASEYTEANNYNPTNAVNVNTSELTREDSGKYVLNTKRVGDKYIIGPININKNNNLGYDIEIRVTGIDGKSISYTYTDANGTSLNTTDIKSLVGKSGGFYISVDRNSIEEVNVQISTTQETTKKTLWLKGTEENNQITLDAEQPVVEIERKPNTITVDLVGRPQEFDLALRKYIIEVNGVNITNLSGTRVPNISESTLQTGTTATYRHKKDPVLIKTNDIVTYSITIYNEGNHAGYARQIIDQLPTGLVYIEDGGNTITSKGKNGNSKNTYTATYKSVTNRVEFNIANTETAKDLTAYSTSTGLDYETLTFKCKVVEKPDTEKQKVLTNVAWISSDWDSVTGTAGSDRDSQTIPESSPNVTQGNMENYKGHTDNKTDLTDSNEYYKGQQDDDDFEKLILQPEKPAPKVFDLALFKHIAAISKDQNIEDGEYITDNGKIDGTYLRAPVVTAIDPVTGKITYREDDKEALTVETGDYVLYTIRVYNEGEINGYASKIKDTLPVGLKFVEEDEKYNGIWNLEGFDSEGRQVVTTTWYDKGNGDEFGAKEGDPGYKANLLKALNKQGAITDENPDYLDAQVLCQVTEKATSNRVLVNYAQISDDKDENGKPIDDIDSTPDEWIDEDDDQDIERIKLQCFDLSLRKFITAINGTELKDNEGKYIRAPKVDVTPLKNNTDTTAIYTHTKKPVVTKIGDNVVYTIRVYNEGDIDGYASEVTDYLPPYLTYIEDSKINDEYGWTISEDGRIATTKYLVDKKLDAFKDRETLDFEDVKIECKISDKAVAGENITNIAEISEYTYNGNVVPKDIDSTADNMVTGEYLPEDKDLPGYKDEEKDKPYIPGNEDDDDFEKVYINVFDLALRKFITQVGENEITNRVPQPKIENGKITYEHTKEPITLHVGDLVTYTLRIYNEGDINGYASEIADDIPEYLEYLPEETTNVEYMWKMYDENDKETDNVEDAVRVKTTYLSKEKAEDNLLEAFNGTNLDFKDIKIAFKVKDPNSNQYIITNHAQITDDTDEDGEPIDDIDSIPDEWNDGEDDQDIENVKVEYFDLALLKFVSKVIVIEDGKQNITETGYNGYEDPEPVVKVELHRKKLSQVTVKFGYGITIINEGDIAGYATEITDYIPEGLRFEAADNPNWKDEGNGIISTRQLEGKLLQPGERATVEVILTWINGAENLALKTNTAEISEDDNPFDVPDKDSTPDNKKDGEDDIDIAKVILSIATGGPKTYFILTLGLLTIVLVGVLAIKKFVL